MYTLLRNTTGINEDKVHSSCFKPPSAVFHSRKKYTYLTDKPFTFIQKGPNTHTAHTLPCCFYLIVHFLERFPDQYLQINLIFLGWVM